MNTIRMNNVEKFIPSKPSIQPQKIADTIELPKLKYIIDTIIKGYQITDETFKTDRNKFEVFCNLYRGTSIR